MPFTRIYDWYGFAGENTDCSFVISITCFAGSSSFASHKDQTPPPEVVPHIFLGVVDPVAIVGHVVESERVIPKREQFGIKVKLVCLHRLIRLPVRAYVPALAGLPSCRHGRARYNDI